MIASLARVAGSKGSSQGRILESSKEVVSAGKAAEDLGLTGRRDDPWVCRSMVDGVALNYEMGVRFPPGPP